MSQNTVPSTPEKTTQETRQETLNRVADEVSKDSQVAPQDYISETEVPHGGE